MADSATAVSSNFNTALLQLAETQALTQSATQADILAADENAFLNAIANPVSPQAANSNATAAAASTTTNTNTTNSSAAAGLLALNTPTLSLFNEVQSDPYAAGISGNLSTQQLQELNILRQDAINLEEASALNDELAANGQLPIVENGSTVDLSIAAQAIAQGNGTVPVSPPAATTNTNVTATTTTTAPTLTTAQLAQIGEALTPVVNQPLTPQLLLQLETQLAAQNQDSPITLSIATLLLAQPYIASEETVQAGLAEEHAQQETDTRAKVRVEAVSPSERVAAEDMAIVG